MLCAILFLVSVIQTEGKRSPIIIVPGDLGSQIEGKINKLTAPHFFCDKHSDWFTLWVNDKLIVPGYDECFVENAKLVYDSQTKEYHNAEGVDIRIPCFGETHSVEYLDNHCIVHYFHSFVKYFTKLGYESGKDIRAAPYDWRFAPDGHLKAGYYKSLHNLIEETYQSNNKTPVTIVAHSMGGPMSMYFLTRYVEHEWKISRIKQFISLSGVFGGAVKSLKAIISGSNNNIPTIKPLIFRIFLRSSPSNIWLFPSPSLWSDKEILVKQPKRNYTVNDLHNLLKDMNYTNGTRMFNEVQNFTLDFTAPNLTHYCFYGTNISTSEMLVYGDSFPDHDPDVQNGDGDGTVNLRSLMSCSKWQDSQNYKVIMKAFKGVRHVKMVQDVHVLKSVEDLVID